MSKKRFNPLEDPPNASSSDEDDEVGTTTTSLAGNNNSSSEEEETDDDESSSLKKPESSPAEKHQTSGSGSDEETDSDSHPVVKPIAGTKDSNHRDSKKVKPLTKSSTKKRPLSETEDIASKKVKSSGSGEEAKKSYFQRVWSEEDEIAALQGLIDYRNETGVHPYDDTNAFYQSVKKTISFDVTKTQILKKLWGLKAKYETNLGKAELSFSKAHDRKAFDLSKLFWGGDGVAAGLDSSAVKSNGKSKKKSSSSSKKVEPEKVAALDSANGKSKKSSSSSKKKVEPEKKQELVASPSSSPPSGKRCEDDEVVVTNNKGEVASGVLVKALARFGVDDLSAQLGWRKLALEDKKRFEEQWKVLQLRELEFYSEKSGFIHEVVTKMAEASRPNP